MNPAELKLIAEQLSAPPFKKTWSVIQIHDDIPPLQLFQTLIDVLAIVDEANPGSIFRKLDAKAEPNEEFFALVTEFLCMLKFKDALNDGFGLMNHFVSGNKEASLRCLHFLLSDLETHKKRAYLAMFLARPAIPPQFEHDDVILDLMAQIEKQQEQFKQAHKWLEGLKNSGTSASTLKREIQHMEEEKQQILAKISRLKKKVEAIKNRDAWLDAAKRLRLEQKAELDLAQKLREQKTQVIQAEKNEERCQQKLKDVKNTIAASSPDAYYVRMEEECQMNKFLAQDTLTKQIETLQTKIKTINMIASQHAIEDADLDKLEAEIQKLNSSSAILSESLRALNANGDGNLVLFRQQAGILASKKEATLQTVNEVTKELEMVKKEYEEKASQGLVGTSMLQGEDFKRYVSELRGKSTMYKRRKGELNGLIIEQGNQEKALKDKVKALEIERGIAGFHQVQETLELVSEKKEKIDEEKGKMLEEISGIVQKITAQINDQKARLAPVIQELRTLRQKHQGIELEHQDKKHAYNSALHVIEAEVAEVEQQVAQYEQDIANDASSYHYLNAMLNILDTAQIRVMGEMKAYIGGDEQIEIAQKTRGFKTYREYYNKKIMEHEHQNQALKENLRQATERHEPNMHQKQLFVGVKRLLELKMQCNEQAIAQGNVHEQVTQDRLFL